MKQDTTELRLTFINVGYGEAILINAPDAARPDGRFYALIDGGSAADSEFADRTSGRIRAEEYLAPLPRLDLATPPRAICPSAIFSRRSMTTGSCAPLSSSMAAASSRALRAIR